MAQKWRSAKIDEEQAKVVEKYAELTGVKKFNTALRMIIKEWQKNTAQKGG